MRQIDRKKVKFSQRVPFSLFFVFEFSSKSIRCYKNTLTNGLGTTMNENKKKKRQALETIIMSTYQAVIPLNQRSYCEPR